MGEVLKSNEGLQQRAASILKKRGGSISHAFPGGWVQTFNINLDGNSVWFTDMSFGLFPFDSIFASRSMNSSDVRTFVRILRHYDHERTLNPCLRNRRPLRRPVVK